MPQALSSGWAASAARAAASVVRPREPCGAELAKERIGEARREDVAENPGGDDLMPWIQSLHVALNGDGDGRWSEEGVRLLQRRGDPKERRNRVASSSQARNHELLELRRDLIDGEGRLGLQPRQSVDDEWRDARRRSFRGDLVLALVAIAAA